MCGSPPPEPRDYTPSVMNDPGVQKIIEFYKEEFKNNLRIALKPFMDKLEIPLQLNIVFGEI